MTTRYILYHDSYDDTAETDNLDDLQSLVRSIGPDFAAVSFRVVTERDGRQRIANEYNEIVGSVVEDEERER